MAVRVVVAVVALFLAGSPASAAEKLSCVKTWDEEESVGGTAHATNTCAGRVEVKFVINNDFDSGWRWVEKTKSTSWGYAGPWAHLDRVLIKFNGEEYVNEH